MEDKVIKLIEDEIEKKKARFKDDLPYEDNWVIVHYMDLIRKIQGMDIEKDFYNELPSMICEILDDDIIPKYKDKEWFKDAWEEYRQHILTTDMDNAKMPGFVFKKYIEKK